MHSESVESTMNTIIGVSVENVFPPIPPVIQNQRGTGEFKYIKLDFEREMLQNAFKAINQTETWDFVKKDIESFSLSTAPELSKIFEKMEELGYKGHSGYSFGWTMRVMQRIAKYGEENFKRSR